MLVGLRLRSTRVAAIFRKSLCLTHEARKQFPSGKITNLITMDANALQQICQQLHGLWSAPFRITMAMVLLYQQLGVASLVGSLMLVLINLMFPIQAFVLNRMKRLTKEDLLHTDKRVGLVNEILAAMDTMKYYAWERSFESKVQIMRTDELTWFRKVQLLSAVVNATASLQWMEELFLAEERILLPNPPLEPGIPAISIKGSSFSWDLKTLLLLELVCWKLSSSEIVAAAGKKRAAGKITYYWKYLQLLKFS